ncbi:MAG: SpaA isopeptide-forming pilin-related protein, partial [Thomasclavelia ramosa]|nr:SpaA isopeptide-forming pilin-related protein [Thomasclavelia ramosa]
MMVKRVKKIYKQLFMVFIMLFSVFSIYNISVDTVNAQSGMATIKRIRNIKYPSALGDYSTWVTEINGNIGYCLEASKNTPVNGDYVSELIYDNENLLKTLYYGCGGPADIISTDGLTPWDEAYVLTHVAASYYYSGDLHGVDLEHVYPGWWKWITETIPSMPTPTTEFNFSESSLTAYYDKNNNEQRTQEITFNSVSAQVINIPLQDGVTLHNVTKGTSLTGTVTVNGGDTFYLSAPLGTVKDTWLSGDISGTGKTMFAPVAILCGGNYQTMGSYGFFEDPRSIELSSKWLDVGSLELRKTNDVGNFIDGAEFSLESVSYDGYSEKLTVKDGKIKVDNLPVGIYKLTETKVPDGHAITQTVYEVEIKKDETADRVVVNKLRPTGSLIINKSLENENEEMPLSEENSNTVNVADYDFSKVQFKITANQVIKDSVSLETLYEKGDPVTVGSGKGSNEDVVELISGKDLGKGVYTPDNNGRLELNGLPMGSYDVEEISCPDGFVLDKEIKTVQFVQEDFVTLNYTKSLNIENEITKTLLSKADIGGTQINGAHVQILNKEKEVVYEFVTGDEPLQIDGLKDGKYYFHEDLSPLGFALSNDIEFTVKDSEIQKVEMTDYTVDVAKVDEQGNYLKGAG